MLGIYRSTRDTGVVVAIWSGAVIVGAVTLILAVFVAVDASKYPDWAFERAGTSKTFWIVVPLVLSLFCGVVSLGVSLFWLFSKKTEIEANASVPPSFGIGFAYSPSASSSPEAPWTPEQGGAAPPSWGTPPVASIDAPDAAATPTEPVPPPPTEPPPPPPPAGR
jgi:hypothetical protein